MMEFSDEYRRGFGGGLSGEDILKRIFERLDEDRVRAREEMKEQLFQLENRIVINIQDIIEEKLS